MNKRHSLILTLLLSLFTLSSCTMASLAVGTVAGGGIAAAQKRGVGDAANDFAIQSKINDLWFQYDVDAFGKLDLTVNQGRVLVTGVVQDPEQRVEAIRLAWQPEGVEQVINEIRVAESGGIKEYANDAWISGQVRAKLTFDKNVFSVNYSVDTVQGVVYLLGIAQSREELNRAIELASTIAGVQKVVSYIRVVEGNLDEDGEE